MFSLNHQSGLNEPRGCIVKDKNIMTDIRLFRFDPAVDKKPRYETYRVPLEGSVLDALRYIYEEHDSSLSFRFGCSGPTYERCGACPVLVKGQPALSCKKLLEQGMTVDPHPKFEVIKDLVVDFDTEKKGVKKDSRSSVKIVIDPERCTACRDCVLLCPVKVFDIQKVGGRGRAVPTDPGSCCGLTCKQCATFCASRAISLQTVGKRGKR
jgi:NAD-dependent dihydropyrimidine dehydrogenase PreA subunit